MKDGATEHPKMDDLASALGIRRREAVGLVELLIHFTASYAERGDVGRWSNAHIARRLDWERDPDELVAAFVASRWVDAHPVHRLVVHDWPEHAPEYTKRKVREGKLAGWAVNDRKIPVEIQTLPDSSGESPTASQNFPEASGNFRIPPENSGSPTPPHPTPPNPIPPVAPSATADAAARTPPVPEVSGFVSMLTGKIPIGLDGEAWPTREAWFEHHRELMIGEAIAKVGEAEGVKFNGAFRAVLMRFWNHKRPAVRARASPGTPRATEARKASAGWQHG